MTTTPTFEQITPQQWRGLAARRVFFGHQSVGGNIIDGVAGLLAGNPEIPLRVVETTEGGSSSQPALYHARIGRNRDPASKTDAFVAAVEVLMPSHAMLKYCYADITSASDPDALFSEYQSRMHALCRGHPGLTVIHATLPLTSLDSRSEWLRRRVRGEATKRDLNVIRHSYNDRLRAAYGGTEPVYDIARIESSPADGTRIDFRRGAGRIEYLLPDLTDDGGHLNAVGRRVAAEHFLALLATLRDSDRQDGVV